jgi:4-amino-4-deoxy-L-arabinose transferase-like glycosyltransferase
VIRILPFTSSQRAKSAVPRRSVAPSAEILLQRVLTVALFVIVPVALLFVYYKMMFPGLVHSGALDFAQVGRNLSEGKGFTTYFLRPLALTHSANPLLQPEVTHGPLYPLILALAFGALGAKDVTVAGVSGLFYLLTVPVVYLLGTRVFNRSVGALAALVFAANGLMLEYAISGLHITLYTFLATSLLLVMYVARTRTLGSETDSVAPVRGPLILSGILTAALYLTDPIFIWVAPVILVSVILADRARAVPSALLFLLPFVALTLPWMIRNGMLTGNPIFGLRGMELWMGTRYYPGTLAYRMTPEELTPGVGLFQAILLKAFLGVAEVIKVFPQISASWMLAFLLPSLLFRFTNPAVNDLRRVMMYSFLGILVGALLLGVQMPVFVALVPTMLVFAIAYLLHLAEQASLPRKSVALLVGLLGLAVLLPIARDVVGGNRPRRSPDAAAAQILGQAAKREEVVLTDQPWLVAWYTNRPAIWLPATDNRVAELRNRFPTLHWLFLTEQSRGFSPEWQTIYDVFRRWNRAVLAARDGQQATPNGLRLGGTGFTLLEGLDGFQSVEPTDTASETTALAVLERKGK